MRLKKKMETIRELGLPILLFTEGGRESVYNSKELEDVLSRVRYSPWMGKPKLHWKLGT